MEIEFNRTIPILRTFDVAKAYGIPGLQRRLELTALAVSVSACESAIQVKQPLSLETLVGLLIGEVARRAGLSTSALRYYERVGLLPPPARVSKRRIYDANRLPIELRDDR